MADDVYSRIQTVDQENTEDTVNSYFVDALTNEVLDDLIATGGTARAAASLIEKCGGTVAGFSFVMELVGIGGMASLGDCPTSSLITMPA